MIRTALQGRHENVRVGLLHHHNDAFRLTSSQVREKLFHGVSLQLISDAIPVHVPEEKVTLEGGRIVEIDEQGVCTVAIVTRGPDVTTERRFHGGGEVVATFEGERLMKKCGSGCYFGNGARDFTVPIKRFNVVRRESRIFNERVRNVGNVCERLDGRVGPVPPTSDKNGPVTGLE